ncbi:MAG: MBOAT family protein [Bdellovibrionaceae bacterium]|nr:MBOAT family protein [Bdellovibrionales bacterium]MCB9086154.1 MBOAT family protein [Pseudobdellovibrionaceae bacterium]
MSLSSSQYLLFLPIVAILLLIIPVNLRSIYLLLASYVFYSFWSTKHLMLLIGVTVGTYVVALVMDRLTTARSKRLVLSLGIGAIIFILGFYKFVGVQKGGSHYSFKTYSQTLLDLAIPLGLSFFCFQAMSYLFDVCRGRLKAESKFTDLALFIAFFPQLVAGPIECATNLLPQLKAKINIDYENLKFNLMRIACGLFKKIVLADSVHIFVTNVFSSADYYYGAPFLLAVFWARYGLFLDLSAYTDIAIGSAGVFGIRLTENFRHPFFATSPTDFWRRFHRSLVIWFSNYLFLPLCRIFTSVTSIKINLMITFFVVGLWHVGDVWHIVWAAGHGALYLVEYSLRGFGGRFFRALKVPNRSPIETLIKILVAQIILCIPAFVSQLGRVSSYVSIDKMWSLSVADFINFSALKSYVGLHQSAVHIVGVLFFIFCLEGLHYIETKKPLRTWWQELPLAAKIALVVGFATSFFVFGSFNETVFVYYQY